MTDRLLYRQVHRTWISGDRVTSQAFRPTPKDSRQISVYDGQKVSAESAWSHYSDKLGLESVGVMAVTETACDSESISVVADPRDGHKAHALLDFGSLTQRAVKEAAKSLATKANAYGWCYRPRDRR